MFFILLALECPMTEYCLVLMCPQHSETQVRVGEFPSAERAFELAELIASDLGIEEDGKWWGWTVEVRSAQGRKLFEAPVAGPQMLQTLETLSGSPAASGH